MIVSKIGGIRKIKNEKLVSVIMNKIVVLCKEDKYSPSKSKKFKQLSLLKKSLLAKDEKITEILIKSEKMKNEIQSSLAELDGKNLRLRSSLLELLGSDES